MRPKPRCARCGRALTDPYSIAVGMGPECRGEAARQGVRLPKPQWRVSHGRVVLAGLLDESDGPLVGDLTAEQPDEDAGKE